MSAGVEWALHCTVLLAVLPPAGTLPGRALAQFHGVSESYLLKHMQALTKAGLCESVSGPTGGYRLARLEEVARDELFARADATVVERATLADMPVTNELPPGFASPLTTGGASALGHLIALRMPAAWNARRAMQAAPVT